MGGDSGRAHRGKRRLVAALGLGLVVLAAGAFLPLSHLRWVPDLFVTADACLACHNGLSTSAGEDVSIGTAWRASMMANSARDPYWQASVRREVLDHPAARAAIEAECSRCHMPMSAAQAGVAGTPSEVFAHLPVGSADSPHAPLAADGVSCALCHQIQPEKLGSPESFVGHFVVDTTRPFGTRQVFGPYTVDSGRTTIMHSASGFLPTQGLHLKASEFCATCHTLYTEALDAAGRAIGRLPEQVPYLEWQRSDFPERASCQSCHMPVVAESIAISGVWGERRASLARHDFRGGNFFMLDMLNRFRADLGVTALPSELDAASRSALQHLAHQTARLRLTAVVEGGALVADVDVRNLAGHKLPTGYPSRRAWLHVSVRDGSGATVFESGALRADGSIVGNANDEDSSSYERHYTAITRPDEVQVYESMMVDRGDRVTTGLLSAVRFVKDNRLLPTGFAKDGAPPDVAVHGEAIGDPDFLGGGDRVRYRVDLSGRTGPYTITAALRFQPVAFRWARNLARYDAAETRRFAGYFDAMAGGSSTRLAADSVVLSP